MLELAGKDMSSVRLSDQSLVSFCIAIITDGVPQNVPAMKLERETTECMVKWEVDHTEMRIL